MGVCQKVLLLVEPGVSGRDVEVTLFLKVGLPVAGDKKQSFDIFGANSPPLTAKPRITSLPLTHVLTTAEWTYSAYELLSLATTPPNSSTSTSNSPQPLIKVLEKESDKMVIVVPCLTTSGGAEEEEEEEDDGQDVNIDDDGKGWVLGGMKGIPVTQGKIGSSEKTDYLVELRYKVNYGLKEPFLGDISINLPVPSCISNKLVFNTRGIFFESVSSPIISRTNSISSLPSLTSPPTTPSRRHVSNPSRFRLDEIHSEPKITWTARSRTRYQAAQEGVVVLGAGSSVWDRPDSIEASFPATSSLNLFWNDAHRAETTRGKENIYRSGRAVNRQLEDLPLIVQIGSCYSEVTLTPNNDQPLENRLKINYDVEVECLIADTSSRWAGPMRTVVFSLDVPVAWAITELSVAQKNCTGPQGIEREITVIQLEDPYASTLKEATRSVVDYETLFDGSSTRKREKSGERSKANLFFAYKRSRTTSSELPVGSQFTPTKDARPRNAPSTAMSPAVMDKKSNLTQASLLRYPIPVAVGAVDCSFEQTMMEDDDAEDSVVFDEDGEMSMLQEQSFSDLDTPSKLASPFLGLLGNPATPITSPSPRTVRTPLQVKSEQVATVASTLMETSSFAVAIECKKESSSITLCIRGTLEPLEPEDLTEMKKEMQVLVPCNRFCNSDAEHIYTVRSPEHCSPNYEMTYMLHNQTKPSVELGYMHLGMMDGDDPKTQMVYVRPGSGKNDSPVLEFAEEFDSQIDDSISTVECLNDKRVPNILSENLERDGSLNETVFWHKKLSSDRKEAATDGTTGSIDSPQSFLRSFSPCLPISDAASIPGSDSGAFVDLIAKAFTPTSPILTGELSDVDRFSTTANASPDPDWPWMDNWPNVPIPSFNRQSIGEIENDSVMAADDVLEPGVQEAPRNWKWDLLESLTTWRALMMFGMIVVFGSYALHTYWESVVGQRAVEKLLREWQKESSGEWTSSYAYHDFREESASPFATGPLLFNEPLNLTADSEDVKLKLGAFGDQQSTTITTPLKEIRLKVLSTLKSYSNWRPWDTRFSQDEGEGNEEPVWGLELFDADLILKVTMETVQFIFERLRDDVLPPLRQLLPPLNEILPPLKEVFPQLQNLIPDLSESLEDLQTYSRPIREAAAEWAAPHQHKVKEKAGEAFVHAGQALGKASVEAKRRKREIIELSRVGWESTRDTATDWTQRVKSQLPVTEEYLLEVYKARWTTAWDTTRSWTDQVKAMARKAFEDD